jgi:hypothetical protein
LQKPLQAVYQWALDHTADLKQAQRDFDARNNEDED